MGHPYIASLWLGSLALIRSRQKLGVLLLGFVLVAVVAGVANPKTDLRNNQRKGIVIYAPIFVFEGVNAIQGILCLVYHGSIQIIANIPGSESPDCVRIRNVECLNGCVNGIFVRKSSHREIIQ